MQTGIPLPGLCYTPPSYAAVFSCLADYGVTGPELWRSNGTAVGTVLVKDIWPGGAGSFPSALTNVNGVLYFVADNGVYGRELWRLAP